MNENLNQLDDIDEGEKIVEGGSKLIGGCTVNRSVKNESSRPLRKPIEQWLPLVREQQAV